MIRFILVALCLLLYLILFIPTMFFLLIVKRFKPEMASTIAQAMVRNTFRLLLFLAGAKVEVRGQNNIPKDGGVLFVSNHRSYFDILAGYGYTYKPL